MTMATAILIISILTIICGICSGLSPWRRVAGYKDEPSGQGALPRLSVVAYVLRGEENLDAYVETLLRQDYPDFEIILVCDASAEATAMLSEKFENVENLHLTFIPPGSHNLSRRKLAQTLGIKRASGEIVLTTSTSVAPRSDQWLRLMAEPFADAEINVVCGYVHPSFRDLSGPAKWYRQMDGVLTSAQWMAEAIKGHPYRGDGYNLAFRRRLFFGTKGYSASLTLVDGDDDIFVSEISKGADGCLEINPDAFVDTRWGEDANRMYVDYKDRYCFTRKYLRKGPFVRASLLSWTQWLTAAEATGIILTLIAMLPALAGGFSPQEMSAAALLMVSLLLLAGFWLYEILTYRRLAERLGAVRLFWAVVPFLLWRPIGNFLFFLNHYPSRKRHYTWVR